MFFSYKQEKSEEQMQKITVEKGGSRLDKFLHEHFRGEITRSQISSAIKNARVMVNDGQVKSGTILRKDDIIEVGDFEVESNVMPEDIALDIVFEDEHLMVINKPRGMVVHPGAGVQSGTLLNALMYKKFSDPNLIRCGIVHRLDKNTCGLMLVAKTAKSQEKLGEMFESHSISRIYLGLVEGHLKTSGTVTKNIIRNPKNRTLYTVTDKNEGRRAVTHYYPLDRLKYGSHNVTLTRFRLETGRTHQIRVHLKSIGHPLIGDPEYNPKSSIKFHGQLLESVFLEFTHPITRKILTFEIQPSQEFQKILNKIK